MVKKKNVIFLFCAAVLLSACVSCDTGVAPVNAEAVGSAAGILLSETPPFGENTFVAINTAADVFAEPDITSARLTQILFNEPIEVVSSDGVWAKIETLDGVIGRTKERNIDGDWTCVDKRRYTGRIVITNREKQVYSQPRNGILIRDVCMGTELFFIGKSDNVYQVALPGNLTGWISENGVFELPVDKPISETNQELFLVSCEYFLNISYLRGGVSFQGIDSAGLNFIAAKINGKRLPRDYGGQFAVGEYVASAIDVSVMQKGDVLFFSPNGESAEVSDAGVYAGDGQFIHVNPHDGRTRYESVDDPFFVQRILGVRRYFKE